MKLIVGNQYCDITYLLCMYIICSNQNEVFQVKKCIIICIGRIYVGFRETYYIKIVVCGAYASINDSLEKS